MIHEEEKFPEMKSITLSSPEDAKKLAKILNEIYAKLTDLDNRVRQLEEHVSIKTHMNFDWGYK